MSILACFKDEPQPQPNSSQDELGLIGPSDVHVLLWPLQLSIVATFNGIIVSAQLNLNMSLQWLHNGLDHPTHPTTPIKLCVIVVVEII